MITKLTVGIVSSELETNLAGLIYSLFSSFPFKKNISDKIAIEEKHISSVKFYF